MLNLRGPIVALLTPFDASGEIEWRAFKRYLSSLSSWGVRTVITNGTTGEFASLTKNERQQVVAFVRKNFSGIIINNVSATCVRDVRDLIAGTQGHADLLLVLPPYYYSSCPDNGLCRFFVGALTGSTLPVMLYHFPLHTGNRLSVDLVAMLVERNLPIIGIKDSSGDIGNSLVYRATFPEMFIFLGNDNEALSVLQKGLSGSVTGAANPVPELLIALQNAFPSPGNRAQLLMRCLDVWNEYRESSAHLEIPLVKAAMGFRIDDFPIHVRAPLTPLSREDIVRTRTVIEQCLRNYQYVMAH